MGIASQYKAALFYPREIRVLKLLAQNKTDKEIRESLGIVQPTLVHYIKLIQEHLREEFHRTFPRAELPQWARENGYGEMAPGEL